MAKEWWNKKNNIPYNSKNFQSILDFYLFNCPSEIRTGNKGKGTLKYKKISQRAITLRKQGWVKGKQNTLLSEMKKTSSKQLEYYHCNTPEELSMHLLNMEKSIKLEDEHFEMIYLVQHTGMSKTSSIFYAIRNALAHGSFSVLNDKNGHAVYYFESSSMGTCKSRIRLREKTLMDWIKLFNSSAEEIRAENSKKTKEKKGSRQKAA